MDFWLYLIALIVVLLSQVLLQNNYQKYRKMPSIHRMNGCDVARLILDRNGLHNVKVIVSNRGTLSDYYDPINQIVCLSSDIYYKSSIASVSVAAHEVGHALQHAENYGFIALRNKLLLATQIASQLGWVAIFIGLFARIDFLFWFGIASLIIIMMFQVVTLPIELNASKRALIQLQSTGVVEMEEVPSCQKMLKAAAFTYIAALISTIAQILRLILIRGNRNND